MKRLLVLFFICSFFSISVYSQKTDYGIIFGSNLDFIRFTSEYEIEESLKTKPFPGINLGGYLDLELNKLSITGSFEYQRTKYIEEPDFEFLDNTGVLIDSYKQRIIKNKLLLTIISKYNFTNHTFIGLGLTTETLLFSTLKMDEKIELDDENFGKIFLNYHYNPITLSIPIIVGYNFNKLNVFARINVGITDNIASKDNFIKEYDNVFMIGLSYSLKKE